MKPEDQGKNRSKSLRQNNTEIAGSFPLQPALEVLGSTWKLVQHLGTGRSFSLRREGDSEMPLVQLVMVLIVVGVLLWLVNRFIPMQGTIKSILNAVVVIAVVLWLLNVFGLFHSFSRIHVGA
jgi:fatty acid desaturase